MNIFFDCIAQIYATFCSILFILSPNNVFWLLCVTLTLIIFPKVNPESRSTPRNFNFAAFRPSPAPPVMDLKFEKKCDQSETAQNICRESLSVVL